ncbi:MAG TPA: CDP-alcohol phosphatidyltransferase family protein [Polyangiaceae bacterium]|nr:CDP-alcohol phosphatidyltransferase family protein [Polyangiaceae bacterium]
MIDRACSLALVAVMLVVSAAYAGRVSRVGAARQSRIDRAGGSPLLGKGPMQMGYWAMRPAATACIAAGIGANAVSWASLALGAGAGAAFALGHLGVGAAFGFVSSVCDALDGMIARETGTASDAGEVLDAAVDRYTELFFLGGLVFSARQDALAVGLALAATAGSMMVSYATAKAEAFRVDVPRGAMRRQERAVYLVLGAALTPLAAAAAARWALPTWVGQLPLFLALALLATVGNVSAVGRLYAVARAVRKPLRSPVREANKSKEIPRDAHAAAGDAIH